MFEIRCNVSKINYGSILEMFRSGFEKYHIPVSLGKAAMFLMSDSRKQQLFISLTERYNEKILIAVSDYLNKNNIGLILKSLSLKKADDGVTEIKLIIDEVDYKNIVGLIIPTIHSSLKNKKELFFLDELLNDSQICENVVSATLDAIPDDMKKRMLVSASKGYSEKIKEMLKKLLSDKGINLDINLINVEAMQA